MTLIVNNKQLKKSITSSDILIIIGIIQRKTHQKF